MWSRWSRRLPISGLMPGRWKCSASSPPACRDLPLSAEGSAEVAARVARARAVQVARGIRSNAELEGDLLETHATPDAAGRALLMQAAEAMRLSARSYTRVLRVARTVADLAGSEGVTRLHVAEALSYQRQVPRA